MQIALFLFACSALYMTITRLAERLAGAAATWRSQVERARLSDRDALPDDLAPPEAFSDRRADSTERTRCGRPVPRNETGRNSRTVSSRLRMSCAGWRKVPTAAEFYAAVHEPTGGDCETAILLTWYHEAHVASRSTPDSKGRTAGANWRRRCTGSG